MNVLGFEFHLDRLTLGEVKVEKTMQQGFLPLPSSTVKINFNPDSIAKSIVEWSSFQYL